MPSDRFFRAMNLAHRLLLRLTRGKLGWTASRMLVLELTTTGRRTGLPRSTLLTAPITEGDHLVVVASRGGDPKHPAWFLNLRDEPRVMVAAGGRPPMPMIAHIAAGTERDRLWPLITRDHPNYARYQARTAREIPVVVLVPRQASTAPSAEAPTRSAATAPDAPDAPVAPVAPVAPRAPATGSSRGE